MATGRGTTGPTKRDRREEARETARRMREEAAKKARRRKIVVQSSVIVGIVAVLAIIGVVVFTSMGPGASAANPKNMASGGILLTSPTQATSTPAIPAGGKPTPTKMELNGKTAHIQIWLDYQCPYCDQFETTNNAQIKQWLQDGSATLEVHPVAILDSSANKQYSTRSAAAASCVANSDPDKFFDINAALFAKQPDEQTGGGLSNAQILSIFKDAGVSSKAITDCVNNQTFASFITTMTSDATANSQLKNPTSGGFGTPTVFVNGERYQGGFTDAAQFAAFKDAAVKDAGSGKTITFPTAS
ncbi:thioredoxin domain-containing protein [Leifsonia shinshuensis]|uniref:DsbA family protein n=1 Tax=Leifsonia TaxID=110932 RepID=UPI0028554692|nr:thioredoxin domain-containing protein [Leifsonia shinshuensis]MDR6971232.1 protein-disulfide isomerase [Leifsonia shinshuensis]